MKSTYRRLIRILSCSLVIAAVLLCSVWVPANALSNVFYVWDYLSGTTADGTIISYNFSFDDVKSYNLISSSGGSTVQGLGPLSYPGGSDLSWIQYYSWPLGVLNWNSASTCNGGVIDIRDFDRFVSFDLSTDVRMSFKYSGTLAGQAAYTFNVYSTWYMIYYDEYGNTLGQERSIEQVSSISYTNEVFNGEVIPLRDTMLLNLPENAVYMCPMLKIQLNLPDTGNAFVVSVSSGTQDFFHLSCSVDSVLENSRTLLEIENLLGDLNDKTDTIINGTDEMQQQADDLLNGQQDLDEQLDDAMAQLEDLQDISDQFAEDQYTDFFGSMDSITNFLVKGPWFDMTSLVSPIMEFSPIVTILTLLVAFINISILFFGR